MRVAPLVVLSPEERAALHRWARRGRRSDLRGLRAEVILRAADGMQDLAIGRELGVGRNTVARWRRRFMAGRLRALERRFDRGPRPGRIPEERVRSAVRAGLTRNPRTNRPWSTRELARTLGISHSTVRRLWVAHGLRPPARETTPARADPRTPRSATDVVGVYLRPPDRALALLLGPSPSGPPTHRPPSDGPSLLPTLTNAVELGPLSVVPLPRRERSFLSFLESLASPYRAPHGIRVIASVPGLEGSKSLERWNLRHPGVEVQLVATPSLWPDRVRDQLGAIGNRAVLRSRFGARSELARSIRLFLEAYAPEHGPFEWTAAPTELAREEAGHRLRYELSVTGHRGFKRVAPAPRTVSPRPETDARVRTMARTVLRASLGVRKGERVTIASWSETLPYANAFVLESLRLGARPLLLHQDEPTYWAAAAEVRPSILASLGDHARAAIRNSDVLVSFFGPSDRERFHALPRPTMLRLSESQDTLYSVAEKARVRAVQLAVGRVSPASARMYGVDLDRWRNELLDASLVSPEQLSRRARIVTNALYRGRELVVHHPNGTNLTLGLRGRRPLTSDGKVPRSSRGGRWELVQIPGGVVQVALDEKVGDGTIVSNVPNTIGVMNAVGDIVRGQWTFERGRLTRFRYDQGQELFSQSYATAGPGRERPGVLSVGLNERLELSPLLMDQAYGTVTFQIGRNVTVGGGNRVGWWAWLLLKGGDLSVDGVPLLREGRLVG